MKAESKIKTENNIEQDKEFRMSSEMQEGIGNTHQSIDMKSKGELAKLDRLSRHSGIFFEGDSVERDFIDGLKDIAGDPQANHELTKRKEYKNKCLDEEGEQLQNSVQNLKISIDADKVVSKELLEYKNVQWMDLKLKPKNISVLKALGYEFPSPVQYKSILPINAGKDVLVRAKNGSGKTLSYLIPIIERIDPENTNLQAIVVTPVRELALQVARFARSICRDLDIKSTPLIGGSNVKDDIIRVSSGVQLLIGTPGRLRDVLSKNLCKIDANPLIVFDEADKLLDSIFYDSIHSLLQLFPKKKQMCMFSATFPMSTKSFIAMNMNNPALIMVSNEYTLFNVTQFYGIVEKKTKLVCLKSLLTSLDVNQCIIYVNSHYACQTLAENITKMGFSCYFINSKLDQDERNKISHNFAKSKTKVLVSSDITTRGTDVQGVNVVINYDLPKSSESYLHRIGRAGRFGTQGCSISLIYENDLPMIQSYASFTGSSILPCSGSELKKFCKV